MRDGGSGPAEGRRAAARLGAVVAGIAGVVSVSAGAALIYPPAGLIVAGVCLVALSIEELRS
jgi:hypothetical protein